MWCQLTAFRELGLATPMTSPREQTSPIWGSLIRVVACLKCLRFWFSFTMDILELYFTWLRELTSWQCPSTRKPSNSNYFGPVWHWKRLPSQFCHWGWCFRIWFGEKQFISKQSLCLMPMFTLAAFSCAVLPVLFLLGYPASIDAVLVFIRIFS